MTQFDPIIASDNIKKSYIDYITTTFDIADKTYATQLRDRLTDEGFVTKGPYLDVSGSFKSGKSLSSLIDERKVSKLFAELEPVDEKKRELKLERPLYLHQQEALERANQGNNLVVTTGTGSGKTECFLLPILNALLIEKEEGTLSKSAVRAIIVYPMNALANDQIKRLRRLLQNYPEITFGIYNGNTEHNKDKALAQYKKTSGNAEFPDPLPNEILSREEMRDTPPHILITNYSMLEYMLLRPKDDAVFSSAKLRFVVLDEAHIYKGTTGMETSMLMRRLRARICTTNVQYILTSATLGGKDADTQIVNFGKQLCGEEFSPENIIRSTDASPAMKDHLSFSADVFEKIANKAQPVAEILKARGITDYAPTGNDAEKIYELLLRCELFYQFRLVTQSPKTIQEIKSTLGLTRQQLIDFVSVCSMAEKDGVCLIKAKYHYFVRALEGAYITLGNPQKLFLKRKEHDKDGQCVFEIAVCQDCGRIAIVGKEENGILHQVSRKSERDPDECDFFLLWDDSLEDVSIEDEDSEEIETQGENDLVVCSQCGAIDTASNLKFGNICDCSGHRYIRVKRVNRTKGSKIAKCPACGYGSFRSFYLGSDAATAVLCTELFEQLPDKEIIAPAIPTAVISETKLANSPFARAQMTPKPSMKDKQKQFLCFSDSRSEAAFFANYMEKSYQEFLRRRGIYKVTKEMQSRGEYALSIPAFVERLARIFDMEHSFDLWDADRRKDSDALHDISRHNAWIAVLNELFNARRATSLSSMGLLHFEYMRNDPSEEMDLPEYFKENYGLSNSEARSLLELIVLDGCFTGALNAGKEMPLTDAEREYIFFTQYEKKLVKCKTKDTTKSHLAGWGARARESEKGGYYPNTRLARLCSATGMSAEDANEFLFGYWNAVVRCGDTDEYALNICDFRIRLNAAPSVKTYRCKKCGRITVHNVRGKCSVVRCNGQLEEINPAEFFSDNHYMNLYNSDKMYPLQMKEHTAQLSRNRQSVYQDAFVSGKINALSCSTTFEMGVDVGGLETVCMRDIPPSPSNYVQRAGRAGRASHTAAFVMTYAKLSSHDFTYYENPSDIISGKISAPQFSLENKKVIYRHIFAIALSEFLAKHPDVYDGDNADIFLNGDGYERLVQFLGESNSRLNDLLRNSVPVKMHTTMGINDGSWVNELLGESGILSEAVEQFRSEVKKLEAEMKQALRTNPEDYSALNRELKRIRCGKDDGYRRSLIDFLTRSNVLPKYGFPVDTVELQIAGKKGKSSDEDLTLARDLQMAIAEYAPGSGVIADGKIYTSRYIRMESAKRQAASFGFFAKCPSCDQFNFTNNSLARRQGKECISCGQKIVGGRWAPTLEPRLGFVTDKADAPDAPLHRPERDYKTDDYYVGDPEHDLLKKTMFQFGDSIVELQSTSNDSLVVVGSDYHKVCPYCGWTSDARGVIKTPHRTPWGSLCRFESEGKQYNLSHVFKTDVVKITFFTTEATDLNTMLSVMYAILEGLSRELGIERTDLKGCLHRQNWSQSGQLLFSIILYDAVAGGAGHVRRLVTDDGAVFSKVMHAAYSVVQGCTCEPSCYHCLRNYYNQRIHDLLDRKKAISFLSNWLGDFTVVEEKECTRPNDGSDAIACFAPATSCIDIQGDDYVCDNYDSWIDVFDSYGFDFECADLWDNLAISKNCLIMPTISANDQVYDPFFVWTDKKIIIFDELPAQGLDVLIKNEWKCFDHTVNAQNLNLALNTREE